MKHEKSCGIIPFIKGGDKLSVLVIKQNNGVVGFPKGHVEPNETEEETALRECLEETNVKASVVKGYREEITYYMKEYDAMKTVVFFVGLIDSSDMKRQESEISEILVIDVDKAFEILSFKESKDLLTKAVDFLGNIKNV